jgi:uncharacterized membrane protein
VRRLTSITAGPLGNAVNEIQIHRLFQLSVALKGVHALIEILGGLLLYFFSTDTILRLLYREGTESDGLIARFARTFSSSEQHFYVFNLVSHGIVNMVLVVGLLRLKLWAYPATFAVLSLFIAYQLYRYSFTQDIGLLVVTALDLIVLALAWHEYRLRRRLPIR